MATSEKFNGRIQGLVRQTPAPYQFSPQEGQMTKDDLTQSQLKELLHYDPDTGVFIWRHRPKCPRLTGRIAGSPILGYVSIRVLGYMYQAHRLAWLYMTGEWPLDMIDHINRHKSDNRWKNLRQADMSLNCLNRGPRGDNKTGHPGVFWNAKTSRYHIHYRGKYLGIRFDLDSAVTLRKEAADGASTES